MADTNIIVAATLQANTDDAVKNVLKLKGEVSDLEKQFKKAAAGSDEQLSALKKLNSAQGDLTKATEDLNKQVGGSAGHFSKIKDQMTALPGPIGNAAKGVQGLGKAFLALITNPVGATIFLIVGALKLLYSAFASTNDGADKMEQIFSGLGAVVDVLRDRVLKFAGAVAKFFSGDFVGAIEEGRSAFSGIGDEIVGEFNKAAEITKKIQELDDAFRDLGVTRAKLNRDLAAAKEIITDETASYQDKKKAIEQVRTAEGAYTADALKNAWERLQSIKDQNALSDTSDEDLQKQADAQAAVYALE